MGSLTRAAAVAHAVAGAAGHELDVFPAAPSALLFLVVGRKRGHGDGDWGVDWGDCGD